MPQASLQWANALPNRSVATPRRSQLRDLPAESAVRAVAESGRVTRRSARYSPFARPFASRDIRGA